MSLTEVLTFAVEKVAKLGMDALKQSANAEQDMMSLATFVGAQNAPSVYHQLQDANTPFSTRTLAGVDKSLMSGGVSSDQALNDTINLANAITAVGGNDKALSDIALNMQRIKIEGKASRDELLEFAKEGINIYQLLADATGKSIEKVKDLKVSYDLLSDAFSKAGQKGGIYDGALNNRSQSIGGKWSSIQELWEQAGQALVSSQEKNIKYLEDKAINAFQKLPDLIVSMQPYIDGLFSVIDQLIPDLENFGTAAWNVLEPFIQLISSQEMSDFRHELLEFSSDLLTLIKPAAKEVSEIFKILAAITGGVIGLFHKLMGDDVVLPVFDKFGNITNLDQINGNKEITPQLTQFPKFDLSFNNLRDTAYERRVNPIAYDSANNSYFDRYNRSIDGLIEEKQKHPNDKITMAPPFAREELIYSNLKSIRDFAKQTGRSSSKRDEVNYDRDNFSSRNSIHFDRVSSGGVRAVTINLGKFFDNFTINTQTINEGIDHLDNAVAESLLRVMNSAAKIRE
ncbi:MAG: hypothetical protein JSS96_12345 [Bacteroidetes bacterium]|nr:hypothetical protein [Bacteroidota bacterium]